VMMRRRCAFVCLSRRIDDPELQMLAVSVSPRGPIRAAFTLTELLTVIAIIGMLTLLLLPAVQSAREAARRATCSNNLAQLGKAIQLYESANGHFPPGAYGASAYSWIVMILPQLEHQVTYDKLAGLQNKVLMWGGKQLQDTPHAEVAGFSSSTLVCPTSPLPLPASVAGGGGRMIASYVAVAGASDSAFMTVAASQDRCRPGDTNAGDCYNGLMASPWRDGPNRKNPDGTYDTSRMTPGTLHWFFARPEDATVTGCTADAVQDGLSNCLMLGEQSDWGWLVFAGDPPVRGHCRSGAKGWVVGKFQPYDTGGKRAWNLTAVNKPLGSRFCDRPMIAGTQAYSGLDNQIGFFSAHGPGAMFVFGDASVRWLDESIDFNLYQRLAIRDTVRGNATLPNGSANIKMLP